MSNINICDWFWLRESGKSVFASRRQIEVPIDDPEYQAWCAKGHRPQPYPKNMRGNESRDEMNNVLRPYGLRVFPLTPAEYAIEEEAREAGVLTRYAARRQWELEQERERRRNR